jgi:Flp pilus assembly protein TadD
MPAPNRMEFHLGPRDEARYETHDADEQNYLRFCAKLCLYILDRRPEQPEALATGAHALTTAGYYKLGLELDERLSRLRPTDPLVLYNLACSLALNRKNEEALDALEKAVEHGYRGHRQMMKDEDLAAIRRTPRFREIARRIKDGSRS